MFARRLILLGGGVCKPCVQARQRAEDVDLDGGAQAEGRWPLWRKDRTVGNKRFHLTSVKLHVKDNKAIVSRDEQHFENEVGVLSLRCRPDTYNLALANVDGAGNKNNVLWFGWVLWLITVFEKEWTIPVSKYVSIIFSDHWILIVLFFYQIQDASVRLSFLST